MPIESVAARAFRASLEGVDVAGFGNLLFVSPRYTSVQSESGTGEALLQAWRELGSGLLDELRGDFALACWNGRSRQGLVAVDRFATHSLYWAEAGGCVAFSSRPVEVPGLLGRAPQPDPKALHAYVYFHFIPAPLSVCRDVARLDGGEAVLFEADRSATLVRYWSPRFQASGGFSFSPQREAFFAGLREGVAAGIGKRSNGQVGCFLSGGTDSSTIAGLVCEAFAAPARTFSIVFDEAAYDERHFSRLAAGHFRTDHVEHVLTAEETGQTLDVLSRAYEQPFGNSSAVPTYVCARRASERGVELMLGGDGGDELYGGNTRYALAWILSHYRRLPSMLREHVLESRLLSSRADSSIWLLRKATAYVDQARRPLPDQIQGRYNLLNRFGPANVFSSALLDAQQSFEPVDLERDVWKLCQDPALINRLLAYDFKFTLGDNDLPKVTRMCHAAGVEVAFPMLSDRLVQHSLQLPPNQKLRGTQLRYFFKQALRGFLPDEIIDKSKHGFGMPFGDWLVRQPTLAARADEALRSLAGRNLIRAEFITELRGRVSHGHAGYYGTMVWVLMMLELWLRESHFADLRWTDS